LQLLHHTTGTKKLAWLAEQAAHLLLLGCCDDGVVLQLLQ
jgi:hypothetical protein